MGLTLTFTANIPQPGDNPSVSQGQLLQNFTAIGASSSSWTTQDHFGFGTGTDGMHLQLNFPANGSLGSMSLLQSGVVTAPGVVVNTTSQLYFKNASATYPLSCVKAFGNVSSSGVLTDGYNVSSTSQTGTGSYSITLTAGSTEGSSGFVVVGCCPNGGNNAVFGWAGSGAAAFTVTTKQSTTGSLVNNNFSFMVLQI